MGLLEAFETIVSYCEMQACCEMCHFYQKKKESCYFALSNLPCDWEWPKIKGDSDA